VERSTILIISDQPDFAFAVSSRWQTERNSPPAFLVNDVRLQPGSFELAIIRTTDATVLESLQSFGRPIIRVSPPNGHLQQLSAVVEIPQIEGWPDLVITVAKQILEREKIASTLARASEATQHLEREAFLGRYILEMRHSLNNALTSILGNSELILMEPETLSPSLRLQLETIRNMGMRMNEILQRFSSLQKEMQLVEQQSRTKSANSAAAGV
jgi:signal transduction histidine kinase